MTTIEYVITIQLNHKTDNIALEQEIHLTLSVAAKSYNQ